MLFDFIPERSLWLLQQLNVANCEIRSRSLNFVVRFVFTPFHSCQLRFIFTDYRYCYCCKQYHRLLVAVAATVICLLFYRQLTHCTLLTQLTSTQQLKLDLFAAVQHNLILYCIHNSIQWHHTKHQLHLPEVSAIFFGGFSWECACFLPLNISPGAWKVFGFHCNLCSLSTNILKPAAKFECNCVFQLTMCFV